MKSALRIVSLLPGATEIACGLGLVENLVGISHECDFPASVGKLPRLTASRIDSSADSLAIDQQVRSHLQASASLYELDVERLATLAPDLILTQAQCDVCAVRLADVEAAVNNDPRLRATHVLSMQPSSLSDVLSDIRRVGAATGREHRAAEWTRELQSRIDAVGSIARSTAPDSPVTNSPLDSRLRGNDKNFSHPSSFPRRRESSNSPRVVCIEWIEPLMLAGNWTPELIVLAGGRNGLTQPGEHSPYVDWQSIAAYDPEVIVVAPCGFDLPRTLQELPKLFDLPGWFNLSAVKNEKVFAIDGNAYLNRCGPRLVDTVEILAHLFHPAQFADVAPESWRRAISRC